MTVTKAIFLSYRRCDSIDITGRIYDRLVAHFGADSVFKDVDSIPFGVNYRQHLEREVSHCPVLLAVIGPQWLTTTDEQGRRIDNPADWVRVEIEAALKRDSLVIPVLVGGAELPQDDELPESLRGLVYRQSALVRHDPDFHRDLDRLIQRLEEVFSRGSGLESPPYGALLDDLAAAVRAAHTPPPRPLTRRRWLRLAGLGLVGGSSALALRHRGAIRETVAAQDVVPTVSELSALPDRLQRAWAVATEVSSDRPDGYTYTSVTVDEFGQIRHQGQMSTQAYEDIRLETPEGPVTLTLVTVSGGTFLFGFPPTELGYEASQPSQTIATVDSFWMSVYPITQRQWQAVAQLPEVSLPLAPKPAYFKGDGDCPVEQVTWAEAVEFCDRLSRFVDAEAPSFRLPNEAEWEYACRANTTTPFHTGATLTTDLANYNGTQPYRQEPVGEWRGTTVAVVSLGYANGFGLYDMHGNVLEWCAPWTGMEAATLDSLGGSQSPADAERSDGWKVVRGGSWQSPPQHCRSAYRTGLVSQTRRRDVGFRIVRPLAAE
jgi:formylglycine-generating enzyme required for sulfatase activity